MHSTYYIIFNLNIINMRRKDNKNIDDILASLEDDDAPSEGFNRSNHIYIYKLIIIQIISNHQQIHLPNHNHPSTLHQSHKFHTPKHTHTKPKLMPNPKLHKTMTGVMTIKQMILTMMIMFLLHQIKIMLINTVTVHLHIPVQLI